MDSRKEIVLDLKPLNNLAANPKKRGTATNDKQDNQQREPAASSDRPVQAAEGQPKHDQKQTIAQSHDNPHTHMNIIDSGALNLENSIDNPDASFDEQEFVVKMTQELNPSKFPNRSQQVGVDSRTNSTNPLRGNIHGANVSALSMGRNFDNRRTS